MKLFDAQVGRDVGALSFPEFVDWRERGSEVFESVGAYGTRGEVLSGAGEAEQLVGVQASLEMPALLIQALIQIAANADGLSAILRRRTGRFLYHVIALLTPIPISRTQLVLTLGFPETDPGSTDPDRR
jgi:hypothetical protein